MFSLLGDGERGLFNCEAAGKNGEELEIELRPGDSMGGLLSGFSAMSIFAHGPDARLSDTADSTGDAAPDIAPDRISSFWPSA